MISKPTTEQILNNCRRELMHVVLPAVADETVKVTVMMLDLVLHNAAVRSAHEVAWMSEEIDELEAFVRSSSDVDAQTPGSVSSLHLDDVVERYRQASDFFAHAMETAVAAGNDELTRRGAALLERRIEHEEDVMGGWSPVGR